MARWCIVVTLLLVCQLSCETTYELQVRGNIATGVEFCVQERNRPKGTIAFHVTRIDVDRKLPDKDDAWETCWAIRNGTFSGCLTYGDSLRITSMKAMPLRTNQTYRVSGSGKSRWGAHGYVACTFFVNAEGEVHQIRDTVRE